MVAKLATKARQQIGALSRVHHFLDSENIKTVYLMFIHSIMEYNSISWMGAAQSHLDKLDKVQHSAEKIGNFTVEPLQARRDAAAISFALKLPDGGARGELKNFIPIVTEPLRLCKRRTRQSLEGTQILSTIRAKSLDVHAIALAFQGAKSDFQFFVCPPLLLLSFASLPLPFPSFLLLSHPASIQSTREGKGKESLMTSYPTCTKRIW